MSWRIVLTPTAMKLLSELSDRRIREKIGAVIDRLTDEPEKQGKAPLGELAGFRSIRPVGQRYRIIYKVRGDEVVVLIVVVGIRRNGARDDVYTLAKKLFRLGLLSE
ncbi:type II toxin-antitoxin system RelE family toxin [Geobacter argillaceus]|uniref:mRNA interferase RelE/StbE n=1 Tax=Geobacter argillaceus TaxID=345631 RepID=A0A562WRX1_9BACT|nr:type II toxin-antitoxin system RelE/ParE family toxin [Geobacter argillaceus]TWJ33162.1 mRNA interferase RelE/StbE [Geobacter argillaceus]